MTRTPKGHTRDSGSGVVPEYYWPGLHGKIARVTSRPEHPWRLTAYSADAADERADELLNGCKPFSNDALYLPGAGQLVTDVEAAIPGIERLGAEFDHKFKDESYMRLNEFINQTCSSRQAHLLHPDSLETGVFMAREAAARIHDYLGTLRHVPEGTSTKCLELRSVIVAAADSEYDRLRDLALDAERLAEEHVESWSFNL